MNRPAASALAAVALAVSLAACTPPSQQDSAGGADSTATTTSAAAPSSAPAGHGDHGSHMGHPADGGPVPAGMVENPSPTYPVGTEVTLTADHMPGMEGATATIVGAYTTHTYAVSYDPTDGGPHVSNHKWVVQEELEGAGDAALAEGSTVTLLADHMPGMKGAEATVDSVTDQTVYVVDVEADGMTMTNHKWVVEDEIEPRS